MSKYFYTCQNMFSIIPNQVILTGHFKRFGLLARFGTSGLGKFALSQSSPGDKSPKNVKTSLFHS
jgi:hypothetical protein